MSSKFRHSLRDKNQNRKGMYYMFFNVGFKPLDRDDAKNALFFWKAKYQSLKALIKRIDPDDPAFCPAVEDLADAKEEVKRFKGFLNSARVPWVQEMNE